MTVKHVVVDGSNLATEGRTLPSLAQLDDAVRAYLEEYKPETVTVVVDASFPNRIDTSERDAFEAALEGGQLIVPPAGVIGRGDAFLLQIADRADAVVLSNDSFQEFHGQYGWLFDQGRPCGNEANVAKLTGAQVGWEAANQAFQTFGGMAFSKEYPVERLFRDARIAKNIPVSEELVLAHIGTSMLGLPKSY